MSISLVEGQADIVQEGENIIEESAEQIGSLLKEVGTVAAETVV